MKKNNLELPFYINIKFITAKFLEIFFFSPMKGEIDRAAQSCEEEKVDVLAALIPKVIDANVVVLAFF